MMGSAPIVGEEGKEGFFLRLAPFASPKGCTEVPRGGMCLCAFLFVVSREKILLGKYADHPAWDSLSGMESKRVTANARGWTIPASHLKFGEDPRGASVKRSSHPTRASSTRSRPSISSGMETQKAASGNLFL